MKFLGSLLMIGSAFASGGTAAFLRYATLAFSFLSPQPGVKGPRVSDLTVALDGEGQELPRGWGVWRQELRSVWTTGLLEKKKTETKGDFLGVGGQDVTEYNYGINCLLIGGRGPISRLRRLKFNQNPVYDWNGGDEKGAHLVWNGAGYWQGETTIKEYGKGIKIRVYPGTANQPVDALLVADKGVGQWTNYPNQWLVALEIPKLKKYGNSMPRVSAEVEYAVTDLPSIIEEIGGWVGLEPGDFDLSALEGQSVARQDGEGFVVDTRKKAGDILGELMDIFHFSLPEVDGVLRAVKRPTGFSFDLDDFEVRVQAGYEGGEEVANAPLKERDEEELPLTKEFVFRDPKREYAPGYRFARRFDAQTKKKSATQVNASLYGPRAFDAARVLMAEEWNGATGRSATLGLEYLTLSAGDEGFVATPDGPRPVMVGQIDLPLFGPIGVQFDGFDPLAYDLPLRDDTDGLERRTPIEPGSPILFACAFSAVESPESVGARRGAFLAGVARSFGDEAWEGALLKLDRQLPGGNWDKIKERRWDAEATIGELTGAWTPTHPDAGFVATGFTVRVWGEELVSTTLPLPQSKANLLVFENGVIACVKTWLKTGGDAQNGRFYTASLVWSGLWGSDDYVDGTALAAGTRFLVLSDAEGAWRSGVEWIEVPSGLVPGTDLRIRVEEKQGQGDEVIWELGQWEARNLQTPSPIVETATRNVDGSLSLAGRARSRFYPNNFSLVQSEMEMDEPTGAGGAFEYVLVLQSGGALREVALSTSDALARFNWTLSATQLSSLFGSAPGPLSGTLALRNTYGLGRAAQWEQE